MTTLRAPDLSAEINALFEIIDGRFCVEVLPGWNGRPVRLAYFGHIEKIEADPAVIKSRIAEMDAAYPVLRADHAAKVDAARVLAEETGLPVEYRQPGGFCLSYGATIRTGLLPDAASIIAAQEGMAGSLWNGLPTLPSA